MNRRPSDRAPGPGTDRSRAGRPAASHRTGVPGSRTLHERWPGQSARDRPCRSACIRGTSRGTGSSGFPIPSTRGPCVLLPRSASESGATPGRIPKEGNWRWDPGTKPVQRRLTREKELATRQRTRRSSFCPSVDLLSGARRRSPEAATARRRPKGLQYAVPESLPSSGTPDRQNGRFHFLVKRTAPSGQGSAPEEDRRLPEPKRDESIPVGTTPDTDLAADLAAGMQRRVHVGIAESGADHLQDARQIACGDALGGRPEHVGRNDGAGYHAGGRGGAGRLSPAAAEEEADAAVHAPLTEVDVREERRGRELLVSELELDARVVFQDARLE